MAINKIPNTYVNNNAAWVPLRTVAIKVNEVIDGLNDITDGEGTETFANITVTDTATIEDLQINGNVVVDNGITTNDLEVTSTVTTGAVITESVLTEDGLTGVFVPYGLNVPQAITGSGAILLSSYQTRVNTTGGGAYTMGDGTVVGHIKNIVMVVDAGDATITPTNFVSTTVTLAAVGDGVTFIWNGDEWAVLELIAGAVVA